MTKAAWRVTNMNKKLAIGAAAAALAISFAPTASPAKGMHKQKAAKCSMGETCTEKLDKTGKVTGWANVDTCSPKGKMYRVVFPCYTPSGTCPPTCKSTK
jgi:hypothetical protein